MGDIEKLKGLIEAYVALGEVHGPDELYEAQGRLLDSIICLTSKVATLSKDAALVDFDMRIEALLEAKAQVERTAAYTKG